MSKLYHENIRVHDRALPVSPLHANIRDAILGKADMKRLLSTPQFENVEMNINARVIYLISLGTIIVTLIFVIVITFVAPTLIQRSMLLAGIMISACIVIMLLVHFSKLRLAANLLLAVIWLIVTLGSITAGGLSAPIFAGYFVIIIISGLISKNRTKLYVTLICVLSAILIANAELSGNLSEPTPYPPMARALIYSFFFIIGAILQNITSGNMSQLLKKTHDSERRYRSLLENIPTITYINSHNLNSFTEYVSPQVEQLVGYSQKEFMEDGMLWAKILHPDDRDQILAEHARIGESGEAFQLEYRLLAKDNRTIWVRDEAALLRDSEGAPQYWLGVWTDITTRKLAEEEQANLISVLTKHTTQLSAAAEVSNASSFILDINELLPNVVELIRNHFDYYYTGIFLVDESQEWAVLKAATGEMGKQMLALGHRLKIGNSSMIGWCISHKKARVALDVGEDAVRFRNPKLPLTRSEIALPLIAHGEAIGAMTIQSSLPSAFSRMDITVLQTMADQIANAIENARLFTERASLINELGAQNAELERFTYTVSHDLRSPLVTIRGFLGYLRHDADSGDLVRFDKDMTRIANAVDKMQELLNDLLELSRIGRIIHPPEDVPFEHIVKESIELISGLLEAGNVQVKIQSDLPIIHGDRTRLVEVMQNLISNSIKFMGDQAAPLIEIGATSLHVDSKQPVFFVRDNGIGIDAQYHERIFGLFNRLDPNVDGTGIGLSLVRRIIEVHQGKIWVESQLGEGTTFLFTLPLAESSNKSTP
jgi:PAS domain S-box-containing protein